MYLTRNDRWASPLYLIGESYGTTRAAGLAGHLVDQGIAFNGLILVSCARSTFRGSFSAKPTISHTEIIFRLCGVCLVPQEACPRSASVDCDAPQGGRTVE